MNRKHHHLPSSLWLLLLAALLSCCVVVGNAQKPEVTVNTFHGFPSRLFFFDDSPSVLYLDKDEKNVYVSHDEGKSWERASTIPPGDAAMLIEHPFDNHYAFVLSSGTQHYRTTDRGKTWQSFEVPIAPAFVPFPLSFHSDKASYGMILYQGTKCERTKFGWGEICHDETYFTKDAFSTTAQKLLVETSRCQFAHSNKDFKHDAPHDLIFCVAFDAAANDGMHSLSSSRLFSSEDFFEKDKKVVDLGIGRNARGVIALAIVSKYAVVALKDMTSDNGEMVLYVSIDAQTWAKAQFPHQSSAQLRENAYTIVESTTHSLAVDVLLQPQATIGTLFVSNSNGTFFVESLKDTNRNDMGFVDFESVYGVDGVGIANMVANSREVEGGREAKKLQSRITFDDGRTWSPIQPPSSLCPPSSSLSSCSLHFHSITNPHNVGRVFSSPAPGLVMGVGSVGEYLKPYTDSETFISTDAGVTWRGVRGEASKYEFGDKGGIVVVVGDEEGVDEIRYSMDLGQSWTKLSLPLSLRASILTTVPDSTSQKFLLIGQIARKDQKGDGRVAAVFLDFAVMGRRQCGDSDFERWYARKGEGRECIMGHKQWYLRRKADTDCYVGHKFDDPVEHEENCPCTEEDYECDFNFIRNGNECVPAGPEPIPEGVCTDGKGKYMGSSGYRLVPGNTCDKSKGKDLEQKVERDCRMAKPPEGKVVHQTFEFPAAIMQYSYFKESTTILVRLDDNSVWQSSNEGYTWTRPVPDEEFVYFYMHSYSNDRAYLITRSRTFYYTTDGGVKWYKQTAEAVPNTFGAPVLHFHPTSDYLIWTGNVDCETGPSLSGKCRAVAYYSTDNGRNWRTVEEYVRNCAWARDSELKIDRSQILCESYREKKGDQRMFQPNSNSLQLVSGSNFFKDKRKLFDRVVGFAKFSEFLIVAEFKESTLSLDLQVSLDGKNFATGIFPPSLRPQNHAYTILESSTNAVFMHLTTSEFPRPYWGVIMKSNGNGTYFGISLDNVNRNDRGFVDFEKMIGLDGIALVNVVSNPQEASVSGRKEIQTRITHNDGGSWKPLTPPKSDSMGQEYGCESTNCALQIHGYTERYDARATYSTPSVPGLIMAVGNVGRSLAPYKESDTFLSRDGGFTWQEVHKDAHLWEFGDYGSVLVMANDEEPTDRVLYSTDEGDTWKEYKFFGPSDGKMRVKSIVTVPADTSRRFVLLGYRPDRIQSAVAVHLDFSSLTNRQCVLDEQNPVNDDFEFWSPAEERQERCLFGRQTLYHRRIRNATCYVGNQPRIKERIESNCPCAKVDFECEYNYAMNSAGECELLPGAEPLSSDETCTGDQEFWYERTAYRKIPYSTCEGGLRWHEGKAHRCPGLKGHGFFFWVSVLVFPSGLAALVGYWYYRRAGIARGVIRLPGDRGPTIYGRDSRFVDTLASIPWYIVGIAGIAVERLQQVRWPWSSPSRTSRGYRTVAVDEDAQVLRFEDED